MAFDPAFLDELRARTPIASVIGRKTRLVRSGRQFKACCPFHGEKTPSFYVYEDHFHCFGCGAHGDAISFVMQAEGRSFLEAVEGLAGEAGLDVPRQAPADRGPGGTREDPHRRARRGAAQLRAPAAIGRGPGGAGLPARPQSVRRDHRRSRARLVRRRARRADRGTARAGVRDGDDRRGRAYAHGRGRTSQGRAVLQPALPSRSAIAVGVWSASAAGRSATASRNT